MTEPRKTPRCYAMVMKCHGIPAEFVRGGFGKQRFVLAEDARALEIETQELAEALEKIHDYLPSPEFYDDIDGPTLSAVKRIQSVVTAALARHRAKQEGPTND